jgi:hypothetical protein
MEIYQNLAIRLRDYLAAKARNCLEIIKQEIEKQSEPIEKSQSIDSLLQEPEEGEILPEETQEDIAEEPAKNQVYETQNQTNYDENNEEKVRKENEWEQLKNELLHP